MMISSEQQPEPDRPMDHLPLAESEWRQFHWAFIAVGGLCNLRGWLLPLAFLLVSRGLSGGRDDLIWYGVAAAATVLSTAGSVVQWLRSRFRVTDRDITLRTGVISRQERVIPFERIQSVNLSEAPLERLFQVTRLSVETGASGGADSEIHIQALTHADAVALRAQLLAGRQRLRSDAIPAARVEDSSPVEIPTAAGFSSGGDLVRKISTAELLIAGATSGRIGAAAAMAGALTSFGDDLIPRSIWDRIPWQGVERAAHEVSVVAVALIALGIVAWLISIAATVLTYGGFEIRRDGDQLHIQYGLLDRRRITVPVKRIQAIRVTDGLLRQPFGYAEIRFHSAGFGADQGSSGMLSPLLPRRDVASFLETACPGFAIDLEPSGMRRLPGRALRRYVMAASIGWVILVALVSVIVWRFVDLPAWWAPMALVITPGFVVLGLARYRDAGWHVADGQFLLRWRALSRVTILTQVQRLQYRELTVDPFQRRSGLMTFRTAVASGASREGFSLPHLDGRDAELLMRQLGRRAGSLPPADVHSGTA